jgi:hypothetical protein
LNDLKLETPYVVSYKSFSEPCSKFSAPLFPTIRPASIQSTPDFSGRVTGQLPLGKSPRFALLSDHRNEIIHSFAEITGAGFTL